MSYTEPTAPAEPKPAKFTDGVPTIGRIVHYQSFGTPSGEYPSRPRAAIVTAVGADTISLCVLNPTGLFFVEACCFDPDGRPGTWRWPPRVVGAA